MHKNSLHNNKYDFDKLTKACETLKPFVFENDYSTQTIDFANPEAVRTLNKAILFHHYNVTFWEFPDANLCPPIPSRADYIHHLAEHLRRSNVMSNIKILDIGTGASCIYPLLGNAIYNWKFVGTDIEKRSLQAAQTIIDKNGLKSSVELRFQTEEMQILKGIMKPEDRFAASMCNPPFYKNDEEAQEASRTKWKGLGKQGDKVVRNFSGTAKELSYKGGEKAFVHNYLYESSHYKQQCLWFTCLVSNISHVKSMKASLLKLGATDVQILDMIHGNKVSRVVAWTFLSIAEQNEWIKNN